MSFPVCAEAGAAPLAELKRMGFTHVRLTQRWAEDETREGWLTLTHHEALLKEAEEQGLCVILRIELGRVPLWAFEKHPDAHYADNDAGVCMHHPGVMTDTLYFIRSIIRALGKYACITHWELSGAEERGVCACEYTLGAYREYLSSTFLNIKAYNDMCGTRYPDFDGVCLSSEAERSYFDAFRRVHAPAAQLAEIAYAIAENDPKRREVLYLTARVTPEGALHPYDDAYPCEHLPDADTGYAAEACHMLMTMDIKRCAMRAGAPLIVDIETPRGALDLHTPSVRDIRRSIAAALMGGATGFTLSGLQPRAIMEAAGALGRMLGANGALFSASGDVRCRVALVEPREAGGYGAYSLRAYHALLTARGVPVDIVRAPADMHDVVIFPACRAADAGAVERALGRGCNVLVEAHPSLLSDEKLCALLGVRADTPRAVEEPGPARMLPRATFMEDRLPPVMLEGRGLLGGHTLRASLYLAALEPMDGASALFAFEDGAAVTLSEYGAAKALFVSTYAAVCFTAHRDAQSDAALRALLELLGVRCLQPRVIMRTRERDGIIAINPTYERVNIELPDGSVLSVEPRDAAVLNYNA